MLPFKLIWHLSVNCWVGLCLLGAEDSLPGEELVNDLIVEECGPIRQKEKKMDHGGSLDMLCLSKTMLSNL